jgi:hypothetical protein
MRAFLFFVALVVVLGLPGTAVARSPSRAGTTPTTTTLSIVPDPSVAGQGVTLTATVRPRDEATGTPTGIVQFLQADNTPLGAPRDLQNGQASMSAWAFAGTYVARVTYFGDATYAMSSGSATMTVSRAETTTTVSSSANPVTVGDPLALTIVVSTVAPGGVAPAGTVTLMLNGIDVAQGIPLYFYGATASAVLVSVPDVFLAQPGSATITARYSGDPDTNPSVSAGLVQTVSAPPKPSPTPTPIPTVTPTPPPATTASALSDMVTPLARALARRGLSALNATTQRLTVAAPGTLVQRVYTPAAGSRARVIAQASHRFAAAGPGSFRLALTAAGRKALREAKRLKLEIVSRFTAASGAVVTSSKKVTVKRGHSESQARASTQAASPAITTPVTIRPPSDSAWEPIRSRSAASLRMIHSTGRRSTAFSAWVR